MKRWLRYGKWLGLAAAGSVFLQGGCLPQGFYSSLLADAITAAATSIASAVAVKAAGL